MTGGRFRLLPLHALAAFLVGFGVPVAPLVVDPPNEPAGECR
jgi:hypothetical protein